MSHFDDYIQFTFIIYKSFFILCLRKELWKFHKQIFANCCENLHSSIVNKLHKCYCQQKMIVYLFVNGHLLFKTLLFQMQLKLKQSLNDVATYGCLSKSGIFRDDKAERLSQ